MTAFRQITLQGPDMPQMLADLARQLADLPANGYSLGFVYASDKLADDFETLITDLTAATSIRHWVGSVGIGIIAGHNDFFDEPAIALLLTDLPLDAVTLLAPGQPVPAQHQSGLALLHADPHASAGQDDLDTMIAAAGGFAVGAILSSRGPAAMVAGASARHGLSGVIFGPDIHLMTGLSQGCTPIGPARSVTAAKDDLLLGLDGKRPLDCLLHDLKIPDLKALAADQPPIHAAILVAGSDRADYMVRNILGLDPKQGAMLLADALPAGTRLQFVRRDGDAASADLDRMLADCKRRAGLSTENPPRGAIYINCIARGRHLFGNAEAELRLIQDRLGPVPLIGLYANGEIYHDRIYGYTGVLLLFT